MWKPVAGSFYGLPGVGMKGVDKTEIVDGGHLLFIRNYAGFVLGFVGIPPIPNRN